MADPGFPKGGANSKGGGGRSPIILATFPKTCMNLKINGPRGAYVPTTHPLDPPLFDFEISYTVLVKALNVILRLV